MLKTDNFISENLIYLKNEFYNPQVLKIKRRDKIIKNIKNELD